MLTAAQKMRLKELVLTAKRSEAEEAEYKALVAMAKEAKYAYDEKTGDEVKATEPEGSKGMSEAEVKALVVEGVTSGLASIGLDGTMVKSIRENLAAGKKLDVAAVQAAVREAVGGNSIDVEAITKAIKDTLPKEALTAESVKSLLDGFKAEMLEATRKSSRMQHDAGIEFPIEHRAGNLSVAQKQLANLCLMSVADTALANSNSGKGISRPKSMNDGITDEQLRRAQNVGGVAVKSTRDSILYGGKALTTTGTNTGAELINTDLSSDLQRRMYLESQLAAVMVASEITMPTNPFEFPLITTRTKYQLRAQTSGVTGSDPGTGKIILNAGKLMGMAEYSYEADEDAVIAMLPMLMEQLGAGAGEALEDCLVNGDTTATHMDSDTEAEGANAAQRLFKGFRKLALAGGLDVSFATGGLTADNVAALRKAMKRFGVNPKDLLILAGVMGYNDIIKFDETLTADKAGPNAARILTGVAPSIYGIPIITSAKVREDLNANGVYDGTTKTKGSILMVHRPSFILGVRKGFTVETDVNKQTQVNQVIASFRRAFVPKETPSATQPMVALGRNYDA